MDRKMPPRVELSTRELGILGKGKIEYIREIYIYISVYNKAGLTLHVDT